jgi:hypothetical protein
MPFLSADEVPIIPNGSRLWPPEVLSAGMLSAGAL